MITTEHASTNKKGLAIILGGTITEETRKSIEVGLRPRIDVLEMQRRFNTTLYDFNYLEATSSSFLTSRATKLLKSRGQESTALVLALLPEIRATSTIYATGEDIGFALATLLRAWHINGPRLVMRLEQTDYGQTAFKRGIYEQYRNYALGRINRVVGRTQGILQKLASIDKVPVERLCQVRETVDTHFFQENLGNEKQVTIPLNGSDPIIVSAGLEMRDYFSLIEAVRGLPARVVIGAGSPWSHNRFSNIEASQVPANVHIGKFNPVQMRALYKQASLVAVPVLPNLKSCGISVILEGWSMNRPVVASHTVGLNDYIQDGVNGLFATPCDPASLRKAIETVLNNKELARKIGAAGHKLTLEDLNLDRYVERIGEIIKSVSDK